MTNSLFDKWTLSDSSRFDVNCYVAYVIQRGPINNHHFQDHKVLAKFTSHGSHSYNAMGRMNVVKIFLLPALNTAFIFHTLIKEEMIETFEETIFELRK